MQSEYPGGRKNKPAILRILVVYNLSGADLHKSGEWVMVTKKKSRLLLNFLCLTFTTSGEYGN